MPPLTYPLPRTVSCPECGETLLGATHKSGEPAVMCPRCQKAWLADADPILHQALKEHHEETPSLHNHRSRRQPRQR